MKQMLDVFHVSKPIIGMLHLFGYSTASIRDLAKREITWMYENGVDAVLAEDYGSQNQEDVEWALDYLKSQYPGHVYGVNLLGDCDRAFVLAEQYGAAFVQMDSVCGHLRQGNRMSGWEKPGIRSKSCDGDFAEALNAVRTAHPVFLLGGVRFKYQLVRSKRSLAEDLALGKERCDAIVVTGQGTGMLTDMEKIREFRQCLGEFPLIVGAGVTEDSVREQLQIADGAIVGSWFKQKGITEYPVDPERVKRFMQIVKRVREECP